MIDVEVLSNEEKQAIEELRKRTEAVLVDPDLQEDFTLFYRFLKARDFDLDKAEKMLKKHIIWRRANQIETILEDFVPQKFFREFAEPSCLGFDREGDLVQYLPMGKLDGRDVVKCSTMNGYLRHWIWYSEKIRAFIKQLYDEGGSPVAQMSLLIDLDGLTLANATSKSSLEILTRLMHLMQENYPEGLKAMYVVNAPGYYVVAFSLLKAMMSNAMLQKVFVLSTGDSTAEKLLQAIHPEVLPGFLGGQRTDPDGNPLCSTFVRHAGRIPPSYHLSEGERSFGDRAAVTRASVPKAGRKEVGVDVRERGSLIRWEFLVRSKDIGFGVFGEDGAEVLPLQRYDTPDGVEAGSYKTKAEGKYVVVFDNSYSWFSSKEVEYCVQVTEPGLCEKPSQNENVLQLRSEMDHKGSRHF